MCVSLFLAGLLPLVKHLSETALSQMIRGKHISNITFLFTKIVYMLNFTTLSTAARVVPG